MQHATLSMEEAETALAKGTHDGGRLLKKDRVAPADAATDADAGAEQAANSGEFDDGGLGGLDEFDDGALTLTRTRTRTRTLTMALGPALAQAPTLAPTL